MDFANVKRFFYWDIKTWMLLFLGTIAIYSFYTTPATSVSVQFKAAHYLIAVVTCVSLSLLIRLVIKKKEFKLSKDAAITGLIIAVILDPRSILLTATISGLAIVLKNIIRFEGRPLFNPAALALVIGMMLFKVPLSWWAVGPLTLLGIWIVYRIGRGPLVVSFLAVIIGLFLLWNMNQGIFSFAQFSSGLTPAGFLAFFMLTEPKTTPVRRMAQIVFGVLTAILAFLHAVFLPIGDTFLVALLIMNAVRPILEKTIR